MNRSQYRRERECGRWWEGSWVEKLAWNTRRRDEREEGREEREEGREEREEGRETREKGRERKQKRQKTEKERKATERGRPLALVHVNDAFPIAPICIVPIDIGYWNSYAGAKCNE